MSRQQNKNYPSITSPNSNNGNSNNNGGVVNYNNTNPSTASLGGAGSAALQPYIFPRNPPTTASSSSDKTTSHFTLYSVLDTVTGKHDFAPTFWVPDTSKGEYSLLAALVKRQSQHHSADDFLPLAMRPDIELANNFSTYKGDRIDLSGDKFKLSRATQTLSQLSASSPSSPPGSSVENYNNNSNEGMMRLSDVKEGIRSGISLMQTDEYFLVKYRDYSEFAVNRWSEESQRERFLAPKYVEKYFAVRVGSQHGVFIPINENQFIRGNEILSTANMSAESFANSKFAVSLNTDQFKAVGAPSKEFSPKDEQQQGANGNNKNNGLDDPDLDLPPPPHPLDFSAEAFNIRWRRFARQQYYFFGKAAIKIIVVGAAAYVIRQYYFNPGNNQQIEQHQQSRRNNRRRNATSTAQVVRDVVSLPVNLAGMLLSGAVRGRGGDDGEYDE